jgi:YD repeat-containing protein
MLISTNAYNVAGRMTSSWNPASGVTTMSEVRTPSGQTVSITTSADGGTSITTNALDGSALTMTGTGVHGTRMESGVEQDGGIWRAYTKQIKLLANNTDSGEWVKTYTDMLGRSYKTVYPDGAYSQSFYNNVGQLIKQRDPDGVVTLFAYNAQGEQSISAVDINRNDLIDYAGTDRVDRLRLHRPPLPLLRLEYRWGGCLVARLHQRTSGQCHDLLVFPVRTDQHQRHDDIGRWPRGSHQLYA